MALRCVKIRYRDRIAAMFALAKLQAADEPTRGRIEQRAYYCKYCRGFHLTSAEYDASKYENNNNNGERK